MYIGLLKVDEEQLRAAKRRKLCEELHFVLSLGASFLLGYNDHAAFVQLDRAGELRNEIEALENGAPL